MWFQRIIDLFVCWSYMCIWRQGLIVKVVDLELLRPEYPQLIEYPQLTDIHLSRPPKCCDYRYISACLHD